MAGSTRDRWRTQLRQEWRETLDGPAALKTARRITRWITTHRLTLAQLDHYYELMNEALEVIWDNGDLDGAVTAALNWLKQVELQRHHDHHPLHRAIRDALAYRLVARAMHRARNPGAWGFVRAAYFKLADRAGGPESLSKLIATDPFSEIADAYALLLGIAVPAARRRHSPDDRALLHQFISDALAFMEQLRSHDDDIGRYHALIAMTFQAVCAMKRPEDRDRVEWIRDLDDRARPRDQRGEITRDVIWTSYYEYHGMTAKAEQYRQRALQDLRNAGLHRHVEELRLHRAA